MTALELYDHNVRWTYSHKPAGENDVFTFTIAVPNALILEAAESKGYALRELWKTFHINDPRYEERERMIRAIREASHTVVCVINQYVHKTFGDNCHTASRSGTGPSPVLQPDFEKALEKQDQDVIFVNVADSKDRPGMANHVMRLFEEAGLPVRNRTHAVSCKIDDPSLPQSADMLRTQINDATRQALGLTSLPARPMRGSPIGAYEYEM